MFEQAVKETMRVLAVMRRSKSDVSKATQNGLSDDSEVGFASHETSLAPVRLASFTQGPMFAVFNVPE